MTNQENNQQADRPAVTFDPVAFQAWLGEPAKGSDGTNLDANPVLNTAYQRRSGEAGWLVETTLAALNELTGNPMWEYGEGVRNAKVWSLAHAEGGPDGGVAGEVMVDGVPVSLFMLTEAELVPQDTELVPGYEAAEYALNALAQRINDVAAAARRVTARRAGAGIGGQLTDDEVEQALTVLANVWLSARVDGGRKRVTKEQEAVAEKVLRLAAGDEASRMGL